MLLFNVLNNLLFLELVICVTFFSRTPDRDFRCFYPCSISRIPVPARGKSTKNEQPLSYFSNMTYGTKW